MIKLIKIKFLSHYIFHDFIVNNLGKCPEGGVLARFYSPEGGGFELFSCPEGGKFCPSKQLPGGWSGLELTDTLYVSSSHIFQSSHNIFPLSRNVFSRRRVECRFVESNVFFADPQRSILPFASGGDHA